MDSHELKVRLKVAQKRDFYTHTLIFSAVFIWSILLWISMGFGPFWPMWVLVAFALTLVLEAMRIGSVPFLAQKLSQIFVFLHPDWEEEEVSKLLKSEKAEKVEKSAKVEKTEKKENNKK